MRFAVCILTLFTMHSVRVARTNGQEAVPFREAFSLNADEAVVRQFEDVQDYVKKKRWEQAAELLIRINAEKGDSLVETQPGRYTSIATHCNLLAAALPTEGLATYRKAIDRQADVWLREAVRTRNPQLLRQLLRRAFCSSSGDEALILLGRWAWDRGAVATARRYWQKLIPSANGNAGTPVLRYPDPDVSIAEIRARLVLCDIMLGDWSAARKTLAEFRKQHAASTGQLAGQSGNLADILAGVLKEAKTWPVQKSGNGLVTFAGNEKRNRFAESTVQVGVRQWSRKLTWRTWATRDAPGITAASRHAACFPVVWKDKVFVADSDRIFAYNLKTGRPAYPNGGLRNQSVEEQAVLYSATAVGRSPLPTERTVGVPWFTLTIHDGRVYARLGSPITGRAKDETRAARSSLICLELERSEGKPLWKIDSSDLGVGWEFEGEPVVQGERAFVVLRRRSPETQIHVACFHATTGKLVWRVLVGTAIGAGDTNENRISHLLLTLAEGRLFLSTNLGAVIALDTEDGRVTWGVTYLSSRTLRTETESHPWKSGLTPCLFHRRAVYVAPADSPQLMAIDAETGGVIWSRRLRGGVRQLIGADDGRLIVSGNRLWGLNAADGKVLWDVGFENPAGYGFGRGTLAGHQVFWPLRKEILVADTRTGRLLRRIAMFRLQRGYGGNLLIEDNRLIVAAPDRLSVYGENAGHIPKSTKTKQK